MAKSGQTAAAAEPVASAAAAAGKKRPRGDDAPSRPAKLKYRALTAPSSVRADKLEHDDTELVLIRVPALFDAAGLSGLALPVAALEWGSVPLSGPWRLERTNDSALANLRVLVRAGDEGDEGAGGGNVRVLRAAVTGAFRVVAGAPPAAAVAPVVLSRRAVPPQMTHLRVRAFPSGHGSAGPPPRPAAAAAVSSKKAKKR